MLILISNGLNAAQILINPGVRNEFEIYPFVLSMGTVYMQRSNGLRLKSVFVQ